MLDRPAPPDHILIETSGLALPKPLLQAFAWPEVRTRASVDGVIAVVDAAAFLAGKSTPAPPGNPLAPENPLEEVFADQLAAADLVVLNKTDLVEAKALEGARRALARGLRPGVKLLAARDGAIEVDVLLGLHAAAEDDLAVRPSRHDAEGAHDHDDFESFVVELGPQSEPARLIRRLEHALGAHDILRVKGFIDVPGKLLRWALQGVGPRIEGYYDRPWRMDEARASRLVVIGRKGLDRPAIASAIAGE